MKKITKPAIGLSENVTTGNINERIVEMLEDVYDSRESWQLLANTSFPLSVSSN